MWLVDVGACTHEGPLKVGPAGVYVWDGSDRWSMSAREETARSSWEGRIRNSRNKTPTGRAGQDTVSDLKGKIDEGNEQREI